MEQHRQNMMSIWKQFYKQWNDLKQGQMSFFQAKMVFLGQEIDKHPDPAKVKALQAHQFDRLAKVFRNDQSLE